jgi:HNH endonuclease
MKGKTRKRAERCQWVKIAPGDKACYWDDCYSQGYICVGWDDVGDLIKFRSREDLRTMIAETYYRKSPSHASLTATELWTLRGLRVGDRVVANKGKTQILAVGTVRRFRRGRPCYRWDPRRHDYRHTVAVDWDTSYRRTIRRRDEWNNTVVQVDPRELGLPSHRKPEIDSDIFPKLHFLKMLDKVTARVTQRQGQSDFRDLLIRTYSGRCAVSECKAVDVLEAAHIRPYGGPGSNHPSNGILLRADLHLLFDKGLLRIDPESLRIEIDGCIQDPEYRRFDRRKLRMPRYEIERPLRDLLRYRHRLNAAHGRVK